MKKWLVVFMAVILLLGMAPFAGAANRLTNSEGFVYEVKEDGTAVIVGYTGSEKNLVIPETVDSIPVTEIGGGAFQNNKKIKTVIIPGCIKK